jgi:peptidoglycan/LPS O-acetylase OafA/YrhL
MAAWLKTYGRGTFGAWDFYLAVACGAIAFALAFLDADVRGAATTVLIAQAAVGVAITSTVFGSLAVFATFYDGTYRRVLEKAGGFSAALMPYAVVGVVAAACGVVGIVAALAIPALGTLTTGIVVALTTLLCAWTLTGTASLVEQTVFHATQRAKLLEGADHAESVRARRLSDPTAEPPPEIRAASARDR